MFYSHGLSVAIHRVNHTDLVWLKATGLLSHADYQVLTPMLESAMESAPDSKIKLLFDATEFDGWELRAAWDDFKLGMKHGSEFEKIAILSRGIFWHKLAAKVGNWFVGGEVKYFEVEQEALDWLKT